MAVGRVLAVAFTAVAAVPTPHGDRPAECIVEIPNGAIFSESGDGLLIEHGNGTLQSVYVHPKCHSDEVAMKYARRRARDELTGVWKDNTDYTNPNGYRK